MNQKPLHDLLRDRILRLRSHIQLCKGQKQIIRVSLSVVMLTSLQLGFAETPKLSLTKSSEKIVLTPIKVSPHVYYFRGEAGMASMANKGFMSNAGFVVTNDGVLVFDALATPVLAEAAIAAIRKVTKQPIKRVIASHYHADHIYGLQAFKAVGAEIWGHENGLIYLQSDAAKERMAQRRADLSPWINDKTIVPMADKWLSFAKEKTITFSMGDMRFQLSDSSGAHSAEDLMLYVENDGVLFAGDLFFTGRIPIVGNADSQVWLQALATMTVMHPKIAIPGHGMASTDTQADLELTKTYLEYLREKMGAAVEELSTFDEAYQRTDWSRFAKYPAFEQANRLNAYGTYLLMEKESLAK